MCPNCREDEPLCVCEWADPPDPAERDESRPDEEDWESEGEEVGR